MTLYNTSGLFDPIPLTNNIQEKLNQLIVLDPTELYDIPSGYVPITNDVEWIKHFGLTTHCWVKGKRLCAWSETWLRGRNRITEIGEIKQHPRVRLTRLFDSIPIPNEWTDEQLLILVTKLDLYPSDNPIAYFLAELTSNQIWSAEPSIENLAAWLAISLPKECKPLEQIWQKQLQQQWQQNFTNNELIYYYQTDDKVLLLRRWLGIAEPIIPELGKYSLPIPDFLIPEFDNYWKLQLLSSECKILDTLNPIEQSGFERIANIAYNIVKQRPHYLNKAREVKVCTYLDSQQQFQLSLLQPPPQPEPLPLDATVEQTLNWVTTSYLPRRRWEIVTQQIPSEKITTNNIANSFVEWILKHYPAMTLLPVADSYLNYSVASTVQKLCQTNPVLWVVVDGLGWLDHQELIALLVEKHEIAVETEIEPKFSILPTKTEYAKWSLYAQLFPSDISWVPDAGKAFAKMRMGKRYTDGQIDKLYDALRKNTHKLYCWDTDTFDSLYHSRKDWQSFYQLDRPDTLESIAKKIAYCLQQYPQPDNLKIIIASDHGQIMGTSEKISPYPPKLEPKGRMAIGQTDDPLFVVLERERYRLPHDVSIIRDSKTFSSFSYTSNKQIIGSHGGLFPEEVVVGVSVLRKSIQRIPVRVSCEGEGEVGKSGELRITVDNPNSVTLTNLCLYIKELPTFRNGKALSEIIPANKVITCTVIISNIPPLPINNKDKNLYISGELTFEFAKTERGSANITSNSTILINQMFINTGIDIDEFL